VSKANRANVDLGHYVAAGGDPVEFLNRFHDRIASVHLKDRTTPAHGPDEPLLDDASRD
jgi:sugar phosphate isomerase/epimerase